MSDCMSSNSFLSRSYPLVTPSQAGAYGGTWVPAFRRDDGLLRCTLFNREQGLDAAADGKQSVVFAVASNNHQTHRRHAWRLDRQSQRAAIEKIDDRGVAQQFEVEKCVILVPGESR